MEIVKKISFLRQKSEDVTSVEEAKELIKKLEGTLVPLSHGVGLAAIQIGVPKKVGVIRTSSRDRKIKFIHLINPVVVESKDEFIFYNEGCLSFPDTFRHTKRYKQVTIKHMRIEDDHFEEETACFYYDENPQIPSDGLVAIAVQHELDHFNGELILDHNIDVNLKPSQLLKRDKVGRNDLCPCGSGKKYKKCCG